MTCVARGTAFHLLPELQTGEAPVGRGPLREVDHIHTLYHFLVLVKKKNVSKAFVGSILTYLLERIVLPWIVEGVRDDMYQLLQKVEKPRRRFFSAW